MAGFAQILALFLCKYDLCTRTEVNLNAEFDRFLNQDSHVVADAIEFLKQTKKHGKPKYIQTDAAKFYPKAMRKVYGLRLIKGQQSIVGANPMSVEHRINNVQKTRKHNVRIETVFSKIKDRVDDFRGIKALWSAPILLAGIVLQHNFIESHTTTGQRPCELAGLRFDIGENRWLSMINFASN